MTHNTWWGEANRRDRHAAGTLTFERYGRAARAVHAVPEGESGAWRVSRWVPNDQAAGIARLRAMNPSQYGRGTIAPWQTITFLHRDSTLVMSDTPDELRDAWPFVRAAHGTVLVNGLGLGCVVRGLMLSPRVERVEVVEQSADVLALVAPTLRRYVSAGRLVLHQDDALDVTWPKGARWTCAWHDIWDNITADNLPSMARLRRRYGQRVEFQECWGEREVELIR